MCFCRGRDKDLVTFALPLLLLRLISGLGGKDFDGGYWNRRPDDQER